MRKIISLSIICLFLAIGCHEAVKVMIRSNEGSVKGSINQRYFIKSSYFFMWSDYSGSMQAKFANIDLDEAITIAVKNAVNGTGSSALSAIDISTINVDGEVITLAEINQHDTIIYYLRILLLLGAPEFKTVYFYRAYTSDGKTVKLVKDNVDEDELADAKIKSGKIPDFRR